ncbi:MAG: hypothetical protein ACFCUV_00835 [Rivularia sp. (in: cyanobacteria)]
MAATLAILRNGDGEREGWGMWGDGGIVDNILLPITNYQLPIPHSPQTPCLIQLL